MPTNKTFPDGFPLSAQEAIQYSYFLSDDEKKEWNEWLKSANPQQQQELVDTLHSIWLEHQSQVVPAGFKNEEPVNIEAVSESAPAQNEPLQQPTTPITEPLESEQTSPDVSQSVATQKESTPSTSTPQLQNNQSKEEFKKSEDQNTSQTENSSKVQEEDVKSFGQVKYSPSPLIEEKSKPQREFNFGGGRERKTENKPQSKPQNPPQQRNQQQSSNSGVVFNISRIRETAIREQLEGVYKNYLSSKQQYSQAQEMLVKKQVDFAASEATMIDKVIQSAINVEKVADYFEAMTQTAVDLKEELGKLRAEYANLKSDYEYTIADLKEELDAAKRESDRLYRTLKEFQNDTRRRIQELSEQSAVGSSSVYDESDTIKQKLELLSSKVSRLEQKTSSTSSIQSEMLDQLNRKMIDKTRANQKQSNSRQN